MENSRLDLTWRARNAVGSQTPRRYLDFIIDGSSLQDALNAGERVTGLGCWDAELEDRYILQLLTQVPGESPSGRVPIYLCGECGDLGCGAITARVERASRVVTWRDFAVENNYDPDMSDFESYRGRVYRFEESLYEKLILGRKANL